MVHFRKLLASVVQSHVEMSKEQSQLQGTEAAVKNKALQISQEVVDPNTARVHRRMILVKLSTAGRPYENDCGLSKVTALQQCYSPGAGVIVSHRAGP